MVRLMLVLAPVMCVMGGIAVSGILSSYMCNFDAPRKPQKPLSNRQMKMDTDLPMKTEVCICIYCKISCYGAMLILKCVYLLVLSQMQR